MVAGSNGELTGDMVSLSSHNRDDDLLMQGT